MKVRKTFGRFLESSNSGGSVTVNEFRLGARDAFEHYKYISDTVKYREGGVWNFWKKMPPQTYQEMADDWADANPHKAHLKEQFWQPDIIRQLGFHIDANGIVSVLE